MDRGKNVATSMVHAVPLSIVVGLLLATTCFGQNAISVTTRPDADGPPTRVSIGIFIVDVVEIDDVAQTFTADALATISWQDDRLALPPETSERSDRILPLGSVWDPSLTLINRRNVEILSPDVVRISADGAVTFEARRFAGFASRLDLREFPFDSQKLRIDVASTRYGPDEVELVVDETANGRLDELSIPGWELDLDESSSAISVCRRESDSCGSSFS